MAKTWQFTDILDILKDGKELFDGHLCFPIQQPVTERCHLPTSGCERRLRPPALPTP